MPYHDPPDMGPWNSFGPLQRRFRLVCFRLLFFSEWELLAQCRPISLGATHNLLIAGPAGQLRHSFFLFLRNLNISDDLMRTRSCPKFNTLWPKVAPDSPPDRQPRKITGMCTTISPPAAVLHGRRKNLSAWRRACCGPGAAPAATGSPNRIHIDAKWLLPL